MKDELIDVFNINYIKEQARRVSIEGATQKKAKSDFTSSSIFNYS